jgi:hypothetical protein
VERALDLVPGSTIDKWYDQSTEDILTPRMFFLFDGGVARRMSPIALTPRRHLVPPPSPANKPYRDQMKGMGWGEIENATKYREEKSRRE